MRSRFSSWKKLSATALSWQLPRRLMLGSRSCWRRNVCHSRLVNWEPWSECTVTRSIGFRRQTAIRSAWSARSVVMRDCADQPTTRHPDLIRRGRIEALLQPVLGHHRGLATIPAGATLVAHLSSDPGQRRKAGNTVLRDAFTLVAQIVGQLAPYGDCQQSPTGQWIAIDLAAVGPGLPDQLGLTCILLSTVT